MSKPRKQAAEARPVSMPSHQKRLVALLIVLVVILPMLSWKIASSTHSSKPDRLEPGKIYQSKPGPWGNLEYVRISLELPDHFVNVDEIDTPNWYFRGQSQEEVFTFFKSCGVSAEQLDM